MRRELLSRKERDALVDRHRRCSERRHADRIKAILLLDEGWSNVDIQRALLMDEGTVRNYKKRFLANGIEGLLEDNYTGRAKMLSDDQIADLIAHLEEKVYLDSRDIIEYVDSRFGVRYSHSGMIALLHSIGMSYKKPKVVPAKADAEQQRQFVEQYEEIRKEGRPVYFMDGVHPTHNAMPFYGWIRRGREAELLTNTGRDRLNINGAYSLDERDGSFCFSDSVNAQSTIEVLAGLLSRHEEEDRIYVFCDNAAYYRSKMVQGWLKENEQVKLMFLPPYSPNLNPIERLWKFFKKKTMYNKYYEKFSEFTTAVKGFFAGLSKHSDELETAVTDNFRIFGWKIESP